jgi:hypothetical protein
MTGKRFFLTTVIMLALTLLVLGTAVFVVDPFFHYRAPDKKLFYTLYDQRSQNDGITRNFDYDSIITGTSMAENFRASYFDELFGTDSVKVCFSGATYKELNDNLKVSYESGHDVRYVLRSLDYSLLVRDKDALRDDMGDYPYWLTNKNVFDDVRYLLNRDVIVNYTLPVIAGFVRGAEGGYTSFDEYSFTGNDNTFGKDMVLEGRKSFDEPVRINPVTQEDIDKLRGNMEQNVVSLAREHPETTFLYFFPPYSMAYWGGIKSEGNLECMLEYKKAAVEQMLECDNIHIFSFTLFTDVTSNLELYRDPAHYCPKINDYIMEVISEDGYGRITKENHLEILEEERALLTGYDYNKLID